MAEACGNGGVMIPAILVAAGVLGFREELALRHFDAALELARSDSSRAEALRAAAEYPAAAAVWSGILDETGSGWALTGLWRTLSAGAEPGDTLLAGLLERDLGSFRGTLLPADLRDLSRVAASLGDSTDAERLADQLYSSWPDSPEAAELLSDEFYDIQYPVWSDDSGRIEVLRDFLGRRGGVSVMWRSRAWQYLLASQLNTVDSTSWRNTLSEWLESCPGDPQPFLTGASLLIDRDSAFAEALELADDGLEIVGGGWRAAGLRPGEASLVEPAMGVDLSFRQAQALLGLGRADEALVVLDGVPSDPFGVEDYHTTSAVCWLRGMALQRAGLDGAEDAWLKSAMQGDVINRWAALSAERLEEEWGAAAADSARVAAGYAGPLFEDVTGILSGDSVLSAGRISWGDWDSDGWPDLLAGGKLFHNDRGSGFTEVTASSGLDLIPVGGGIWGDVDRDGDEDLVTCGATSLVLLNEDGTFLDASCRMGVHPTEGPVEGVGLCDWNADGWLDMYLACYERAGTLGEGCPDRFLLGGSGGFRDATDSLGMTTFAGRPLCGRGVSPCDYDRDGDTDIFVSDYRLQENLLWANERDGARNLALETGTAGVDNDGWWGHTIGSAWGDLDNDGDWDLFSANLAHPRYIDISNRSELLVAAGGAFTDERAARGIRYEETHSVPVWGDWDDDGLLDLYITSVYENRRSFLYRQKPDGSFEDITYLSGTRVFDGWGAAAADFDRDGRLDLAVGSGSGMRLFRNVTAGGHWLLVAVRPPEGANPSGIGCTVEIVQDGVSRIRQIAGGSGTTCQDGVPLHFGLPTDATVSWKLFLPGSANPVAEGGPEEVDRLLVLP